MAVISVRLNQEEERILNHLSEYLHEDKSTLLKKSLYERYEDVQDLKFVDRYIKKSLKKASRFVSADDLFPKK